MLWTVNTLTFYTHAGVLIIRGPSGLAGSEIPRHILYDVYVYVFKLLDSNPGFTPTPALNQVLHVGKQQHQQRANVREIAEPLYSRWILGAFESAPASFQPNLRGPKDHINIWISHSGSKAQYKRDSIQGSM